MTLEEAIKNREECLKYLEGLGQKASPQNVEAVMWSVKALEFMRDHALTPPNEPLTLEELREMGGQPYWHVGLREESPPPHWNILDPFYAKHIEDYRYGENWLAYRRPPEGEVDT